MSYNIKLPSCIYGGEGCIANIKEIIKKEKVKRLLFLLTRVFEKSGYWIC